MNSSTNVPIEDHKRSKWFGVGFVIGGILGGIAASVTIALVLADVSLQSIFDENEVLANSEYFRAQHQASILNLFVAGIRSDELQQYYGITCHLLRKDLQVMAAAQSESGFSKQVFENSLNTVKWLEQEKFCDEITD